MTPDKRVILEAAAKACGLVHVDYSGSDYDGRYGLMLIGGNGEHAKSWDPIDNSLDTASMCARLNINTFFYLTIPRVECSAEDAGDEQTIRHTVSHDGTTEGKEAAWRLAASMVAAKLEGYVE